MLLVCCDQVLDPGLGTGTVLDILGTVGDRPEHNFDALRFLVSVESASCPGIIGINIILNKFISVLSIDINFFKFMLMLSLVPFDQTNENPTTNSKKEFKITNSSPKQPSGM